MKQRHLPLVIFVLASCGKNDSSAPAPAPTPTPSPTPAFDAALLTGTWETGCEVVDSSSTKVFIVFKDMSVISEVVVYTDTTCFTANESIRVARTASYGQAVPDLDSTYEVNYTTTKVEAKYLNLNAAQLATVNQNKQYGYSDWANDSYKDVAGRKETPADDAALESTGTICYSIFKFKDGKFYGADYDSGDCSAVEKRPTRINTSNIILTKQ